MKQKLLQVLVRTCLSGLLVMLGAFARAYVDVRTNVGAIMHCSDGHWFRLKAHQRLRVERSSRSSYYRVPLTTAFQRRCPGAYIRARGVSLIADSTFNYNSRTEPSLRDERLRRLEPVPRSDPRRRAREDDFITPNGLNASWAANNLFKKLGRGLAVQCRSSFLGNNDFGRWGAHARSVLDGAPFEEVLARKNNAFTAACPAYPQMNLEQRKNLIILVLMAQANFESSCRPQAANRGCPNGTCYGILQLHLGNENDYLHSTAFKGYCPRNASRSPTQSIGCGLAMFMESMNRGESIVDNKNSYWEVLRPNMKHSKVKKFRQMLAEIPDCQRQILASHSNAADEGGVGRMTSNRNYYQRASYSESYRRGNDSSSGSVGSL